MLVNRLFIKKIPMLRILIPTSIGILLQYHLNILASPFIFLTIFFAIALLFYTMLSNANKYAFGWISGVSISFLFIGIGGVLSYNANWEHNKQLLGNFYQKGMPVLVTLQEPISTKPGSYKSVGKADAVLINDKWVNTKGNVLLYFKKDSLQPALDYGSQIIVTQSLQTIINSGNPGTFNYKRYCSFQRIYHQTYLPVIGYIKLPTIDQSFFKTYLIKTQTFILSVLRKNVKGKNELSIAEALLIGYRDDLDIDLVKSYSNTGVVHIIAISGLHLGMIYGLLVFLLKPFSKRKGYKLIKPIVILLTLWGFTFIAGAAPSILRSAVMFSFIVLGDSWGKRTNMYNSLAASAFVLMVFDPFCLWDVGFQLSYTAVLSIVVFSKQIKNWLYFKNKLLENLWSLSSMTLSAQILTLPIVLYHFHQFPNLFLITNLFAVPFSGLILYAELLLLVVCWVPYVNTFVGGAISYSIDCMNRFILWIDAMPYAVWGYIQISIIQAIILYVSIGYFAFWLNNKKGKTLVFALSFTLLFFSLRSFDFIQRTQQQKLVVYNVPKHTAIDMIDGRSYQFIGDSILQEEGFLQNFHIKPSRVLNRISPISSLNNMQYRSNIITGLNKRIIIIDDSFIYTHINKKINADVIVITKNPKIHFYQLLEVFNCSQYIFDSSNSLWKIQQWKKDADSLHLRHFSTTEQGAFVMDL